MKQIKLLFESEKTFQIWDFNPTHSQLLIRCPRLYTGEARNTDLQFKVVRYLSLPQRFEGIKIHIASNAERKKYLAFVPLMSKDYKVYILTTAGRQFQVVASAFFVEENDLLPMKSSIDNDFGDESLYMDT